MKNTLFALIANILVLMSLAQSSTTNPFKGLTPRAIGPAGMSGRVTSVDVNPRNVDHIILGTASGGVWESKNGGINWKPIFDKEAIQSVGSVLFDPSNPSIIWVGTGEGNPRNSQNSGKGIYKSIDGGKNWKLTGLENTKTIHRIIVDPRNSDVVYVASLGSAWGPNKERGVFKSTNGGKDWVKILFNNDTTGCADLIMDPNNPNKLFAAMWQYHRQPWFFTSGGKGSGLYVSNDGGNTWNQRTETDGLPKGQLGRIGLAVSKKNSDVVYALVESKKLALYKSYDGGVKWSKIGDKMVGNRPFYYADIYADPSDERTLYSLYSFVTKSTDGGRSFKGITPYYKVHPDHHAFWINPNNSNHLIDGNDGGLAISKDGGKTWRYVTNLPLAQFYHINVDNQLPYNIYGGMQDNGSWKGPAYVFENGGIKNHHWQELLFGDGFDVVPQPGNPYEGYAMYQGGNVSRYNIKTKRTSFIKPIHPEGIQLRFNWNAAIAQNPFDSNGVYFGSQFLHKSNARGDSWEIISPDLTTNDTAKQKQALSGGLTIDATNAENYTTITCISPSLLDSNIIWVGTDDGNVQLTTDGGENWQNLSAKLPQLPAGSWIAQIHTNKFSVTDVFVVANDYRRNNWSAYVYYSSDNGKSWKRIVNDQKVDGHVWSFLQDTKEKNLMFCGTDQGLYVSFDGANTWQKWQEGIPSTPVSDIKIQEREGDLVIATFGRAAYVLDDIEALRYLAREQKKIEDLSFKVFNPKTSIRSPRGFNHGIRFEADAEFKGQNRRQGSMITLYISPKVFTEKVKKDSSKPNLKLPTKHVEFVVFDGNNDTLRYSRFKPDSLVNRFYWNQREDGVEPLMRKERTIKKDEERFKPDGLALLPGEYKIKFFYKTYSDSCKVLIEQNPHSAYGQAELMQRFQMQKAYQVQYMQIVKEVDKLKSLKSTVTKINGMLELLNDSIADSLRKEGKNLTDSANALLDEFFLAEDFVGYDHVSIKLSNKIWMVNRYLYAENALENETLDLAIDDLNNSYAPVKKRMESLFNNEWQQYRNKVFSLEFNYFKKFEEIEQNR